MLTRYRRQNVEGARLLVGERWDARSQLWLPCYPDLIARPRHTPAGRRVLLCLEDACAHAALDDSGLPRLRQLPPLPPAAPGTARHLRPPVPGRSARTCSASAPPAARTRCYAWERGNGRQPLIY